MADRQKPSPEPFFEPKIAESDFWRGAKRNDQQAGHLLSGLPRNGLVLHPGKFHFQTAGVLAAPQPDEKTQTKERRNGGAGGGNLDSTQPSAPTGGRRVHRTTPNTHPPGLRALPRGGGPVVFPTRPRTAPPKPDFCALFGAVFWTLFRTILGSVFGAF